MNAHSDVILAKDIMSPNPITVDASEPIIKISKVFNNTRIWGLYVVENGKLVGVITRLDMKYRASRFPSNYPARKIMSTSVISITPNTNASQIIPILDKYKIHGIAVIENGSLCGVVTRTDINNRYLPMLAQKLSKPENNVEDNSNNGDSRVKKQGRRLSMMSTVKSDLTTVEIAKALPIDPRKDLIMTKLVVPPTEVALIIVNGKISQIVKSDTTNIGGFLSGNLLKDVEVVFIDLSSKESSWTVDKLRTSDNYQLGVKVKIKFEVNDPEKFYKNIFASEAKSISGQCKTLSLDFLNGKINDETLDLVLAPKLRSMTIDEIGSRSGFQESIRNEMGKELGKIFDDMGLILNDSVFTPDLKQYEETLKFLEELSHKKIKEDAEAKKKHEELDRESKFALDELNKKGTIFSARKEFEHNFEIKDLAHNKEKEQLLLEIDNLKYDNTLGQIEKDLRVRKLELDLELLDINEKLKIQEYAKENERKHELDLIKATGEVDVAKINASNAGKEAEVKAKDDLYVKAIDGSTKLMEAVKPNIGYPLMCGACHIQAPNGSRFCPHCGKQLI